MVGIGTTSPIFTSYAQLTVKSSGAGGIVIQGGASDYSRLFFAKDDTSNVEGLVRYYHADNSMQFWTAGSEKMRIASGGDVGIGTTSPSEKLTINGTNPFVRINNTSTSDSGIKINYNSSNTHGLHLLYNPGSALAYIDNTYQVSSGQVYGDIYFRQNVGGTMTTRMAIKADGGSVGIGTTSPTHMLDITTNKTGNGAGSTIRINRPDNVSYENAINWATGGTNKWFLGSDNDSTENFYLYNWARGAFEITVLSASGNVGIGTTSPARPLDVNGTMRIADGSSIEWGGTSTAISGTSASNALLFYTTSSERMRITSGGNVLIGTTTDSGYKLDVNGTGRFTDLVTSNSGFRTNALNGFVLRNDANSTNLGGLTRRSFWAGGTALDTQIFAETGYSIFINPGGSSSIGLTLASTGAATFSSSVTAASNFYINNSNTSLYGLVHQYSGTDFAYTQAAAGSGEYRHYIGPSSGWGGYHTFYTDNSEKMRITSGGNVGIGTTSASHRLTVTSGNLAIESGQTYISSGYNIYFDYNVSNNYLIRKDGTNLLFNTGGSFAFSGGNVGIGTTAPTLESGGVGLNIVNSSYTQLRVESSSSSAGIEFKPSSGTRYEVQANTSSQWFVYDRTNSTYRLLINSSGNVGIGTTSPGYLLDVNGSIGCVSLTETSSKRYKENINTLDNALSTVLSLRGVTYNRKGGTKQEVGVIAEEVEQIIPEIVNYTSNHEPDSVSYSRLTAVLIEAIKQQQKRIDELEQKILGFE